ncbi:MAG: winged helix-turn-helix domain-containing protein [Actinomycetales bacterium]|nr:winged helix-turn-helix domain-containing protein [Actinomycetales bacterium]
MRFGVLGPVTARDGDAEVPLGGPRQRAVLALLLRAAGRPVPADRIVDAIWGEAAGPGSHASLHTYVSNLRGALGGDRLVRDPHGYRVVLREGDELDTDLFAARVEDAGAGRAATLRAAGLSRALELWRGEPYEGLDEVGPLAAERARLTELRTAAELDRVEALLRAGEAPVAEATAVRDRNPLDERAWSLLAHALYRAGRQTDALAALREVTRSLSDELGLDPSPALVRLEEQILLHDPALEPEGAAPALDVPAYLTSFVGRVDELKSLEDALAHARLVTVVGPGGAGKTRLAVEVARRRHDVEPATVRFADLARVTAGEVARALAAAVHAPDTGDPTRRLAAALAGRHVLLVIDNAEHVADAVAEQVGALLARTDRATVLVTSRVPLGVPGERLAPLGGMGIGDGRAGDAEQLFADRCAARGEAVSPTDPEVREVCRRLDGIPLALELAAARVTVLSPAEILGLLDRRFALLVDQGQPRDMHRSLEATVGWSYGLLDERDRSAFAALGVFDGPFTAPAATAVVGDGGAAGAPAVLDRLVASSLVTASRGRPTRFRLLETLRAYARDRLVETDRWGLAVDRHDTHYLAAAIGSADELLGRGRVATCERVEVELAEYEAAFARLVRTDPVRALPLGWTLGNAWLFGGHVAEAEERLRPALEATEGVRTTARADLLMIASWVAVFRNRFDDASRWTDEGLAIYREHDDVRRLAYGLARAGHWAFGRGDPAGVPLLREALEVCARAGLPDLEAWPLALLAQARLWSGDGSAEVRAKLLDARERFGALGETYGVIHADMLLTSFPQLPPAEQLRLAEEMVALSAEPGGDNLMRPIALHNLAYAVASQGSRERAAGLNRAAVRSAVASGTLIDLGLALFQAARFASDAGRHDRAVVLLAAGEAHFAMDVAPFQRAQLADIVPTARAALGGEPVAELERIGAAMSADAAAAFAASG